MISRGKQRGAVAVELAILLPPMLLLAFGTAEFGRAVSDYNTMVKSVRDGARYLSLYAPGDAARINDAKSLVVFGCISGTYNCPATPTPLVAGLTTAMVSVCDRSNCPGTHNLQAITNGTLTVGAANLVTIQIDSYTFSINVPFFGGSPSFTAGPISATMMQVL